MELDTPKTTYQLNPQWNLIAQSDTPHNRTLITQSDTPHSPFRCCEDWCCEEWHGQERHCEEGHGEAAGDAAGDVVGEDLRAQPYAMRLKRLGQFLQEMR